MREINAADITAAVREMCIQANLTLAPDMVQALENAGETEVSPLGKKILGQLKENLKLAKEEQIPICQDTGMAVFFVLL